jgi:predicted MFS family arabinose efflux permease
MSRQEALVGEPAATRDNVSSGLGYAWVILVVVWLAGVAAALNLFKVPPLIPVLLEAFHLQISQAGLLMSVFALTGFILALPAALFLRRLGPKTAGLLAVGCLVVGSGWGAMVSSSGPLFASRILEGAGMGLIAVVAPAAIALWFPPAKRGGPMGIWATWIPVGNVVMLNLAPALETAIDWRAVWWAGAGFALVCLILYWLFVRLPPSSDRELDPERGDLIADTSPPLRSALANRSIWLLAFEFACFNVVFIGFFTFFPTFLVEVRGFSLAEAAFITSVATLISLGSAPLAGWLSDRLGTRRLFIALPFLVFGAMMLWPFHVTGGALIAFVVLLGIISGPTPTATFAAAPEVMGDPRSAGIGMAVIAMGINLGFVVGPFLFGLLVQTMGWTSAGYLMLPVALLGFVAAWFVDVR